MQVFKRHPVLTVLAAVVSLEWAVLAIVYFSLSYEQQVEATMSPDFILAIVAAAFILGPCLVALPFVATAPSLRPSLPLVLTVLLVVAGVLGIWAPFIARSGCGCEGP